MALPHAIDDPIQDVLRVFEKERKALLESNYTVTPQKVRNVKKCFDIHYAQSIIKNLPKQRAKLFLDAASEELIVLCACATDAVLIGTLGQIQTELHITRILNWWGSVLSPPHLESLCIQFRESGTIVERPGKRARLCLEPNQTSAPVLSKLLDQFGTILKLLYPTHDIQSLLQLNRQELIDLLQPSSPQTSPSPTSQVESGASQDFHTPNLSITSYDPRQDVGVLDGTPFTHIVLDQEGFHSYPSTSGPAATIRNLKSQDLFDFLKQCGCSKLVIPETDNISSIVMVYGSSYKVDVEISLKNGIRTRLLEYIRILGADLTVQDESADTTPRSTTIQSQDLFYFLSRFKGGCDLLEIQSSFNDITILPSITITYEKPDEAVKIFLQRYLVDKLCEYVMKTYGHRRGYPGLVFN